MFFRSWFERIPEQKVGNHLLDDEGEYVVDLVRHHWVVYTVPILYLVGAFGLVVVALFGPIELGWFFLLSALALALYGIYRMALERRDVFVITNMRVFRVSGVFNIKIATIPITRLLDITVDRPLVGRICGFGHLVFESAASTQGLRDIRYVGQPSERDMTIQRVVQRAGLRGPRGGSPI
ncbi:MAG: PH domain-containing protein [Aeromicrobium sp.]|uniref:PH domain-containing protein n=1 Tax=Aeromicrobium sp. TaxID=1871063 RepID=UPI0039E2850F